MKKALPYIFLHLLLIMYSAGGIFSKKAAAQPFLSLKWLLLYSGLIFILAVYAVCWQQLLKKIPLNIAYVNKSITLVWTMLFGAAVFGEHITVNKLIGAVIVAAGSLLITLGGKEGDGS